MKLLKEFEIKHEAEALVSRLRSAGVLAALTSAGANRLSGATAFAVKVGVWVVLDDQFNDANALISNKHHAVEAPLTEARMTELEQQGKTSFDRLIKRAGFIVVSLVVAFTVTFLVYINGSGS